MPRDVNDVMREEGPDAVRKALDGAMASETLANHTDPAGEDVQRSRWAVMLDDFCAYMVMHKYIFMDTGDLWPASSVDARIPPIPISDGKEISASKWLDRRRPVEQITWAPGRPQIISGQVIAEGGWIDRPGCSVFNLYRPPIIKINNGSLNIGDWDGDGRTDLLWFRSDSGDNRWYTNRGATGSSLAFLLQSSAIVPSDINNGGLLVGDWDGTGTTDAIWYRASSGWNRWYKNDQLIPDLIATVTDGLGAATGLTYKPLTDSTVYSKGGDSLYPLVDLQGAMQVVARLNQSNGIGGERSTIYSFAGAKTLLDGRGFLGFREMKVTDLPTGLAQTTSYRQDYPFIGLTAQEKKTQGGVTLGSSINTHNAADLGGTRRLVTLTQSTLTGADLDGTALPSATTTYQYDAYGNATQITVTHSDGYSKTTTNIYSNDTTKWLLGRLTGATVLSHAP